MGGLFEDLAGGPDEGAVDTLEQLLGGLDPLDPYFEDKRQAAIRRVSSGVNYL